MDIFKAIFASDDEDSDDDEEQKEPDEPPPPAAAPENVSAVVAIPDDKPVDLGTFKPTFIPREGKSKASSEKEKGKKEKKKKEKKNVLVSFEMDEDGAEGLSIKPVKDRHKKKRRKEKQENEDDESMWVEKLPPEAVASLAVSPPAQDSSQSMAVDPPNPPPTKGRKRAIDFM